MIDSRRFLMLGGGISTRLAFRVSELGGHALVSGRGTRVAPVRDSPADAIDDPPAP